MPGLILPTAIAAIAGAMVGGLIVWWRLRRSKSTAAESIDPFLSAELDQAAAKWATDTGQPPQAAVLLADKLHLLHHLGEQRRQP